MLPPAASPTCPGPTPPAASPARPRATRRLSCSRSGPGRRATSSPLTAANPPSPGRLLHSGWLMMCSSLLSPICRLVDDVRWKQCPWLCSHADAVFEDGVVLGADTRATEGPIVANRNCEKIHYMAPNIYC